MGMILLTDIFLVNSWTAKHDWDAVMEVSWLMVVLMRDPHITSPHTLGSSIGCVRGASRMRVIAQLMRRGEQDAVRKRLVLRHKRRIPNACDSPAKGRKTQQKSRVRCRQGAFS